MEKITEEELRQLKDFSLQAQNIFLEIGQIELQKISLVKRREILESEYEFLKKSESSFIKKMTEKYGPIVVNPENGEIEKNPS
jgi:hypothetical protein